MESNCNYSTLQRIRLELKEVEHYAPDNCSASLIRDDDLFYWNAQIISPFDCCYEGGVFKLLINFPIDYPFKPPKIKFMTKIYHPNINEEGSICMDILKDQWTPALTIAKVLISICSILSHPLLDEPLNEVGGQYTADREAYARTAKDWTKKFAIN